MHSDEEDIKHSIKKIKIERVVSDSLVTMQQIFCIFNSRIYRINSVINLI